jgi:hypothetical protein
MIINLIIPTILLIFNIFIDFHNIELSMFYSLNMILIVVVIVFNFLVLNFVLRLLIPLISVGMMRNAARFAEIFQ